MLFVRSPRRFSNRISVYRPGLTLKRKPKSYLSARAAVAGHLSRRLRDCGHLDGESAFHFPSLPMAMPSGPVKTGLSGCCAAAARIMTGWCQRQIWWVGGAATGFTAPAMEPRDRCVIVPPNSPLWPLKFFFCLERLEPKYGVRVRS